MADVDFERRLLQMFDQPPHFADADRFARSVDARLDRGWNLRQMVLGAFGVIGGIIGSLQMIRAGFVPQLETASQEASGMMTRQLDELWRAGAGYGAMPVTGEVVWMAAALGVMALVFAVTRAVEEF
jgi:hypothetical protein